MSQISQFQDLQVWRKAHELTLLVYRITRKFPNEEKYGLVSQIQRATVSVASNIVEGFKRKTVKDSLNFYNTANASLEEMRYQLLLSRDLGYISEVVYSEASKLAEEVSKMLYAWIKSQKTNTSS